MPTKRIKDLEDINRPREKLIAKGAAALSDMELLAALLGSGTRGMGVLELASTILPQLEQRLDRADVPTLRKITGVGQAKACQIVAALELARRHLAGEKAPIREAKDALPFLQQIRDKRQEYFVCLSLDARAWGQTLSLAWLNSLQKKRSAGTTQETTSDPAFSPLLPIFSLFFDYGPRTI